MIRASGAPAARATERLISLGTKRRANQCVDLCGIEFGDGFKVTRKKPSVGYDQSFDVVHLACGTMRVLTTSKINQARKNPTERGYRAQVCVPCKKAKAMLTATALEAIE